MRGPHKLAAVYADHPRGARGRAPLEERVVARLGDLLGAVGVQHGAFPQRARRPLQQRVHLGRVRVAQPPALPLHPPDQAPDNGGQTSAAHMRPTSPAAQYTTSQRCLTHELYTYTHIANLRNAVFREAMAASSAAGIQS